MCFFIIIIIIIIVSKDLYIPIRTGTVRLSWLSQRIDRTRCANPTFCCTVIKKLPMKITIDQSVILLSHSMRMYVYLYICNTQICKHTFTTRVSIYIDRFYLSPLPTTSQIKSVRAYVSHRVGQLISVTLSKILSNNDVR